jgi:solute carrier family 44 protein 1 (choline transporter-like protein)
LTILGLTILLILSLLAAKSASRIVKENGVITSQPSVVGVFAVIVNIPTFIWLFPIICGCQRYIITSTITQWYFSRDKTTLTRPMVTSYYNLIAYHLGSVCIGSWFFIFVQFVKILLKIIFGVGQLTYPWPLINFKTFNVLNKKLSKYQKFPFRNAYVLVSKNNTPFFDSGRHALHYISENFINVVSRNFITTMMLFMSQLMIAIATGFVAFVMMVSMNIEPFFTIS